MRRLFIGFDLPQQIQKEIKEKAVQLCKLGHQYLFKWVRPENYHVTLKFLGPVSE